MSGSSLDGIDLAYCGFSLIDDRWQYSINEADTIPYSAYWKKKLEAAQWMTAVELFRLDVEYGRFLGETVRAFLDEYSLKPDLVASHGHTVFHEPFHGFSFQLGKGAFIAKYSGVLTVSDFRNEDIKNGGQGAPLVPIGDEFLFGEYIACINIGGIANISFSENGQRKGYDICGANQLFNTLCREIELPFDAGGKMASSGEINNALLDKLNSDDYFGQPYPKSLSNQYVVNHYIEPIRFQVPLFDRLATAVKHVSHQIACAVNQLPTGRVLVTGGGAYNSFLVDSIQQQIAHELVVPEKQVIDFKEALIFGFMGVLRIRENINCLGSVTGAFTDSMVGIIDKP